MCIRDRPRNVRGVFGSSGGNVVRGPKTGTYAIYGEYPEYIKIATSKVYDGGRFINENDMTFSRKVCVIGERTLKELFEKDENPIGKFIAINSITFKVIGVHKFVQGGGFGDDGDIYIPFITFKDLFNSGDNVGFFMMSAYKNADQIHFYVPEEIGNTDKVKAHDIQAAKEEIREFLFRPR